MQLRQIKIPDLPAGNWAIYWMGKPNAHSMASPQDPHFWVQFESDQLDEQGKALKKNVSLPAGFLPSIHVGHCWVDNGLTRVATFRRRGAVQKKEFKLDVQAKYKIDLASNWTRVSDYELGKGYLAKCGIIEDRNFVLVYPLLELGRFYWGTSTKMMQALVTGMLLDVNNFIKSVDSSGNYVTGWREDGGYQIVLQNHVNRMDAWYISRLILDQYARESVKNLFNILLADEMNERNALTHDMTRSLEGFALFPFVGETKITVQAVKLSRLENNKPCYLILSQEKCSHEFPVEDLSITRDDWSDEAAGTIRYPASAADLRAEDNKEDEILRNLMNIEPSRSMDPRQIVMKENRFTWLRDKTLKQIVTKSPEPRYEPYFQNLVPIKDVSTGVGDYRPPKTQRLRIRTAENVTKDNERLKNQDAPPRVSKHAQFSLLVSAVEKLQSGRNKENRKGDEPRHEAKRDQEKLILNWAVLLPHREARLDKATQDQLVKLLPSNTDTWWRISGTQNHRQCQWIELETKRGTYYIFEIEPRSTFSKTISASSVLSFKGGRLASYQELKDYMKRLVYEEATRATDGMNAYGWKRTGVKHMEDGDSNSLSSRIVLAINRLRND